ncbi:putative nuclease HARBI1 [Merluccius polli]|uniref:Nuclease HARBI1 n=1 Tax=Merluccius polli TaxID=89951 RepID=A0AA47PAY0_MERPO|nr:putative nuclease HARBI1 [Merluccius polli]
MAVSDFVQSAGRAVLDMVEREWEPLSQGELEQRLDRAVEDILEADLVAMVQAQAQTRPPAMYVHLVQAQQDPPPVLPAEPIKPDQEDHLAQETLEEEGEEEEEEEEDTVDSHAVKHITELLQNSTSHYGRSRLAGRARISLSHTVMLSLALLSKRVSYRSVSGRFRREKGNIHRIYFSFCERVNMLQDELIRWPRDDREAGDLLCPLYALLGKAGPEETQGVPQVLGILGHTRIPIRLPVGKQNAESSTPEVKRMKKEAHPDSWLNLELVCDRRGRFLHCQISKGSETGRAALLRDRLGQQPQLMPPGSCLVARAGYPLTEHILTPYVSCVGPREGLYNKTLEAYFSILDQAVASLKARFQRLQYLDMGNYERARAVVLTACILHNVFLDIGPLLEGEVEEEEAGAVEAEGDVDEEGLRRRDAITDLLYKGLESTCA